MTKVAFAAMDQLSNADVTDDTAGILGFMDAQVPDHVIPDFSAALKKAGTAHEVQVFAGTQHGFQFAERQVYAPVAAEEAWSKVFGLWDRRLK